MEAWSGDVGLAGWCLVDSDVGSTELDLDRVWLRSVTGDDRVVNERHAAGVVDVDLDRSEVDRCRSVVCLLYTSDAADD